MRISNSMVCRNKASRTCTLIIFIVFYQEMVSNIDENYILSMNVYSNLIFISTFSMQVVLSILKLSNRINKSRKKTKQVLIVINNSWITDPL